MSIIAALKTDNFRIGNLQAIEYNRKKTEIFKPGFLGEIYFMMKGNRYSNRDGDGILQAAFCGMKDLSYDAIISYLATRAIVCLGVWVDDKSFQLAGFCYPTVLIGADDEKSAFGAYIFFRKWWGTDEQEVLAVLGLSALFSELNLLTILGVRYSDNELTAKFMSRFGFRDCGTLPHYLAKRGKLVSATVSELSRERFEEVLAEMLGGSGSGQQDHRDKRRQLQEPQP